MQRDLRGLQRVWLPAAGAESSRSGFRPYVEICVAAGSARKQPLHDRLGQESVPKHPDWSADRFGRALSPSAPLSLYEAAPRFSTTCTSRRNSGVRSCSGTVKRQSPYSTV